MQPSAVKIRFKQKNSIIYADLNKRVFKSCLKLTVLVAFFMYSGIVFHSVGLQTAKALSDIYDFITV